jgi:hypothetical protein
MFWKRTIWWILLGVVVLALLAIGGVAIYRAGFTHGAMTNLTLSEGNEFPAFPHRMVPYRRPFGMRSGLSGFFPALFCFGGLFMVGLAFAAFRRRHYWKYADKEYAKYWKHHGPPPYWHAGPWGPGKPPWAEDQPESEPDAPSAETDDSEE